MKSKIKENLQEIYDEIRAQKDKNTACALMLVNDGENTASIACGESHHLVATLILGMRENQDFRELICMAAKYYERKPNGPEVTKAEA